MNKNEKPQRQCGFCNLFISKDEFHEEFDFYKHPAIKGTLRELKKRLNTVGNDVEAWAVKRKLRSHLGVVMPGYGRLIGANRWLKKLEEQDSEIATSQELAQNPPAINANLPF